MNHSYLDRVILHNCHNPYGSAYDCDKCFDWYACNDMFINHDDEFGRYERFVSECLRTDDEHRLTRIQAEIDVYLHQKKMINIREELITAAMHPRRIERQMSYYNDIEAFFSNC